MDENTMYWLFTTAPQAIAALVGIIFTGMFFMAESIDNRVRADQSLAEIGDSAAKTALYKNMRIVAVLAAATIVYDLFLVAIVKLMAGESFCLSRWLIIFFAALNFSTICCALNYVFQAVSPNYFNEIAKNLSSKYKSGEVDKQVFLGHFIENLSSKYKSGEVDKQVFLGHFIDFERVARSLPVIRQMDGRYFSIRDILRVLVEHQMITPDESRMMSEISKVRNLMVHGEPIEKVDRLFDDELQRITNKIKSI